MYWSSMIALGVLAGGLLGCEALVEATKAPFEATTALSQGTVEASSEFTKPTTDLTNPTREFTSATLGMERSDPAGDQPPDRRRARKQLESFTAHAFENVRADIARGDGEYLVSLATLAGVPADRHKTFAALMHEGYGSLYDGNESHNEGWARVVSAAWSAGYGQH
jgi:hypothetical protein